MHVDVVCGEHEEVCDEDEEDEVPSVPGVIECEEEQACEDPGDDIARALYEVQYG